MIRLQENRRGSISLRKREGLYPPARQWWSYGSGDGRLVRRKGHHAGMAARRAKRRRSKHPVIFLAMMAALVAAVIGVPQGLSSPSAALAQRQLRDSDD